MKIGIPRALYYFLEPVWLYFFEQLDDIEVIYSKQTTYEIFKEGIRLTNDEACLALKIFVGHVASIADKCDYLFLPKLDNYGLFDQTCANHVGLYDIINNQFSVKLLNCNIDIKNNQTEKKAFYNIGQQLKISDKKIKQAYIYAINKNRKQIKKNHQINCQKLNSSKLKILVLAHPYNSKDEYIGKPIIAFLKSLDCEVIYSDEFDKDITNRLAHNYSHNLYWKYSKEAVGSLSFCHNKIDGILFLTVFPCGLDSLVNELLIHKINKPYLNLIIDELDSMSGIQTRLESFIDILKQVTN